MGESLEKTLVELMTMKTALLEDQFQNALTSQAGKSEDGIQTGLYVSWEVLTWTIQILSVVDLMHSICFICFICFVETTKAATIYTRAVGDTGTAGWNFQETKLEGFQRCLAEHLSQAFMSLGDLS